MIFRIPVIFIFLIVHVYPTFGNRDETIVDTVFFFIYNQQFTKADSVLLEDNGRMSPLYFDILNIDLHWWKYIQSRSDSDLQQLISLMDKLDEKNPDTMDKKVKQLIVLSYKLRYEFMRYNLFGAIRFRSQIKHLLEKIDTGRLNYTESQIKLFYLYSSLFDYFDNIFNPLFLERKNIIRNNSLIAIETYIHEKSSILQDINNEYESFPYFSRRGVFASFPPCQAKTGWWN
jgi:hypothetical protein